MIGLGILNIGLAFLNYWRAYVHFKDRESGMVAIACGVGTFCLYVGIYILIQHS
jgi:hypothetical protein